MEISKKIERFNRLKALYEHENTSKEEKDSAFKMMQDLEQDIEVKNELNNLKKKERQARLDKEAKDDMNRHNTQANSRYYDYNNKGGQDVHFIQHQTTKTRYAQWDHIHWDNDSLLRPNAAWSDKLDE